MKVEEATTGGKEEDGRCRAINQFDSEFSFICQRNEELLKVHDTYLITRREQFIAVLGAKLCRSVSSSKALTILKCHERFCGVLKGFLECLKLLKLK